MIKTDSGAALRRFSARLSLLFLLSTVLLSGCTLLEKGAPAGYDGGRLSYEDVDFTVLEGRRIVLDPGHGGRFTGAVGPAGLAEKDVNLRVALTLRDLLAGYGAEVTLTRASDTDLLPEGSEGPVRADLAARADTANSREDAELFISIHHNSRGVPDPEYNATETYYKMGDTGPSLDLARYLHRHLMRGIGLPRGEILPGNYFVLRHTGHPAVLGEASYLSHPGVEKKLSTEAGIRREAYSYLIGIVDYLDGGVPVVEDLRIAGGEPVQDPWPLVLARITDPDGGAGIDPQRFEVTLDGSLALETSYDRLTGELRARPAAALPNGPHNLAVRVRNLQGNAAREGRLEFNVAVPPAHVRLSSSLTTIPLDGRTPARITASVSDLWSRPVADSTDVLFIFSDPNIPTRVVKTANGRASVIATPAANEPLTVEASCGNRSAELVIPVGDPRHSVLVLNTIAGDGAPLGGVRVQVPGAGLYTSSPEGMLTLEGLDEGDTRVKFLKDGYLPAEKVITLRRRASTVEQVRLKPVLGGRLHSLRVMIDPAGGLGEPGQTGPEGLGEADVNLAVALMLADYLERAGAEVSCTRDMEQSPRLWERVMRAERFQADIVVSIAHNGIPTKETSPATVVRHYPGSTNGRRLAQAISSGLKGFLGRPFRGPSAGYERILQQVSMPAVLVRAASVAEAHVERGLSMPGFRRAEALAVFNGICRYAGWEPEREWELAGRLSDGRGNVVAGALVMVDSWLPLQSDERGMFCLPGLESRPHRIDVYYGSRAFGPYTAEPGRNLEILLSTEE